MIHLTLSRHGRRRPAIHALRFETEVVDARVDPRIKSAGAHDGEWGSSVEIGTLVDIYKTAQVNFYLPAQREHAEKWIKQTEE